MAKKTENKKAESEQRIFSAPITVRPKGHSLDLVWPENRLFAVLVHDETLKFKGLVDFMNANRKDLRATLTIQIHEPVPVELSLSDKAPAGVDVAGEVGVATEPLS